MPGTITTSLLAASCALADAPSQPASIEELLEHASKWVVAIQVERTRDLPSPPFARRRASPEGRSYFERPKACVSGILAGADGHVLTSYYNVAGELKSIEVILPSGTTYPAKLLGKSPEDDVALLQIDHGEKALSFEEPAWADESALQQGRMVFAIGRSPDPSRVTATRGIISAGKRNGGRALQTDAELNYGNSGGPIVDLDGRIVGMAGFVGHVFPQWGLNSGVGFGATTPILRDLLPRLKKGESIAAFQPPFLGVQSERVAIGEKGARVTRVVEGSGAGKAGLKQGDVIVELDGAVLDDFDHMRRLIFAHKVDDKVQLKVRRGDEVLVLEAVLGPFPKT